MSKQNKKYETIGDRRYESADYERRDDISQGLATTHEQASDTLTEGTYDAQVDQVDQDGRLVSHKGKHLSNKEK
ncbi:YozQ family protein [Halobacillus naozhouensis]|uniref:YozQ family protein n=1 Tax=Halobacillus naozhouensis TaxID=554880 RepID=A0ABY8IUB8_9BACI|nr:YozQ family protein [Halobacillus naozhouensis]WFT73680.1 YozQ family protein [Halobacillus naozhouensis]